MPHGQRRVSSGWRTNSPSHRELLVADFQVGLSLAAFCSKTYPARANESKRAPADFVPVSRLCRGSCPPERARPFNIRYHQQVSGASFSRWRDSRRTVMRERRLARRY